MIYCLERKNEVACSLSQVGSSDQTMSSDKSMSSNQAMSSNTMSTAVSSMESVGMVRHGGDGSSEGLGLGGGPVLSLEWLGDGLVGNLTGTNSYKTMVSNYSVSSGETMSSDQAMSTKSGADQRMSHSHRVGNSMEDRSSVGNHRVGNGVGHRNSSNSRVGHISNIASGIIGVVVDGLDAAVGEVDGVGAIDNTGAIVRLGLAEGSARVLVSDPIVVGVGGDLS